MSANMPGKASARTMLLCARCRKAYVPGAYAFAHTVCINCWREHALDLARGITYDARMPRVTRETRMVPAIQNDNVTRERNAARARQSARRAAQREEEIQTKLRTGRRNIPYSAG